MKKIDLEFLRACLDVDYDLGKLYWKHRPREHFKNNNIFSRWNNKMPGNEAGCTRTDKNKRTSYSVLHISGHGHIAAHHIIYCMFYNLDSKPYIDHIDQNGLNNSIHNLRESDPSSNMKNKRRYRTNKTGIAGVRFSQDRMAWEVTIPCPTTGKSIYKRFKDLFEACCFRKSLELKLGYFKNHGSD